MPVLILDEAHTYHVLGVVGVVVDRGHGAELVEALDEHPLVIEVREAHGALQHLLAASACPVRYRLEEGIDDLSVVDEVDEAEAGIVLIPRLVGAVVDDPCDTTDDLALAIGEEVGCLAKLECGVAGGVERQQLILDEPGDVVGIAAI